METKDRLEILAIVERLGGMMSIIHDVIAAECHHSDNDGLDIFRENIFDNMYGEIDTIKAITSKPFPNYQGHDEQ